MTNGEALRTRIKASGYKLGYVAKYLNISAYTLQKKLDNETEFKVSEVDRLAHLLGMNPTEKDIYFFAPRVEFKSTRKERLT